MIKLLIGGSPCTYWSCAQKNNRETEPSGMGWELFENYLIAKEKFQPDIFLYENNKSAAQPIKDEIKKRLNVWDGTLLMPDSGARYIEINSALVSAQNRQRFYVHNCGDVQQPKDRGILLRDILESGVVDREKAYCLRCCEGNARDYFKKRHTQIAFEQAEPVRIPDYGQNDKARPINAHYSNNAGGWYQRIGSLNPSKQQIDMIAAPVNITNDGKSQTIKAQYAKNGVKNFCCYAGTYGATGVAEPIRIGTIESNVRNIKNDSKQYRVYSPYGKSTALCGQGGGVGAKTGLYACPIKTLSEKEIDYLFRREDRVNYGYIQNAENPKAKCITANISKGVPYNVMFERADGKIMPIYEVKDGQITIKGKQYPIKLKDGYYIIRKLTVAECCRLQGMPDWWFLDNEGNKILSDSQAYKGLGNGWQLDTVKYILEHGLKNVPRNEELIVLSLYDGIATGRRILEELGFAKVKYYAYEIDKYCIKLTSYRYPDIIHCGDAFQVRNSDWKLK